MKNVPKKVAPRFFSERRVKRRIFLIALCYFLFFAIIVGRTFSLHLADNTKLTRLAQTQYQKKITLAPKRGNIYDAQGEEMAIDVKVDSLYANPRQISDGKGVAEKLAAALKIDGEKIEKSLEKDKHFVWIKRRISPDESSKIQAFKIEGLGFVKEYKRFYPNKNLAATVLGAVGLDSMALGGLELFYDESLKSGGEPVVVDQDARGQTYSPSRVMEAEGLHHVQLTLDKTIQFITEKELAAAMTRAQAKSGIAVVMNSRTGEILAMASSPDFDPNEYSQYDLGHWKNRVITDSFEPGSIFKGITAAAALESGKVNLDQKFNCEGGAYQVGKFTINDHGHYGAMALPDIIRVSSNIGMFKISQVLGREQFSDMIHHFGFGSKTEIDLPGEVSGILAPASKWSMVQQGTIAFGQGISVTPIQIVTAYSAIANGGYLMRPFIVKRIFDSNGNTFQESHPQIVRKVISEANARQVVEMLKGVVGPGGTGRTAQVEEYGVAGKTGTAQKVLEGKSGYADGKYIGSFVGFAPADDPMITVLVSINEPKGSYFGGVVAAPVFREIVRQTLPYLRIPPRGKTGPIIMTKADEKKPEGQTRDKKSSKDAKKEKEPVIAKNEKGSKKKPESKPTAAPGKEIPAQLTEVEPGVFRLPDYTGKPLREILRGWGDDELKLVVEGSGLCAAQDPPAGQLVQRGSEIKLSFRPPS